MKNWLHFVVFASAGTFMSATAGPSITNADWTFPATTSPGPVQPIAADLAIFSINDYLGWVAGGSHLNESFVLHSGNTTALEFSYNGNQSSSLNGSTLTLTSITSGLGAGQSLSGLQLSYDINWSNVGSSITNIWAYSLNGGSFQNFATNLVAGGSWLTTGSSISGLVLQNSDTIVLQDTLSGATGNNQGLDFDNIQLTAIVVPEPPSFVLAVVCVGIAGWRFLRRTRQTQAG